jgi:hypothetical protein
MTEFLDLPGGRIAYDVTGEGPPSPPTSTPT